MSKKRKRGSERMKKGIQDDMKHNNIHIIGIPEEKKKSKERKPV